MIRAVGFDVDNTLIDFLEIKIENAGKVYVKLFGANKERVERGYRKFSGLGRRQLFDKITEYALSRTLSEKEYTKLSAEYDVLNRRHLTPNKLYTDTISALLKQKRQDRLLYISSAVPLSPLIEVLQAVGIRSYFQEILGSDIQGGKGAGHIRFIMKKYKLKETEIVHIGDELLDMQSSKEAGIYAIGISHTRSEAELMKAGADAVITALAELDSAIKSINS